MPVVTIGQNTGDDFSGSDANNIYENEATTVQTGNLDVGKYDTGFYRMGLAKFGGLSNLPAGLTVNAATLFAYNTSGDVGIHVFTSRRLLRNWVRAEATWNIYSTGNNWTTAGGTSNGNDRSSTTTGTSEAVGVSGSYYDVIQDAAQLRADIEDMVDNASTNYGWHFERTDGADDTTFKVMGGTAATDGQRIYLEVDYTAAAAALGLVPVIRQNYRNMGYS